MCKDINLLCFLLWFCDIKKRKSNHKSIKFVATFIRIQYIYINIPALSVYLHVGYVLHGGFLKPNKPQYMNKNNILNSIVNTKTCSLSLFNDSLISFMKLLTIITNLIFNVYWVFIVELYILGNWLYVGVATKGLQDII